MICCSCGLSCCRRLVIRAARGSRRIRRSNRGHLQHYLLGITQIHGGKVRILLAPLGNMCLVTLVAIKKMIVAEMRENVAALLWHEHAGVLRISQVDLGELVR